MKRVLSLTVLVLTVAGCAGGVTYVKHGVTQPEANRDLRLCKAWASGAVPLYRPTPSYKHRFSTPYGGVSGTSRPDSLTALGDLAGMAASLQQKQNLVEACMEHNRYQKVYGQPQVWQKEPEWVRRTKQAARSSPCSKMPVRSMSEMLEKYDGWPSYRAIAKTPSRSIYGWSCGDSSQEQANKMAIRSCQDLSREACKLYAIGDTFVE